MDLRFTEELQRIACATDVEAQESGEQRSGTDESDQRTDPEFAPFAIPSRRCKLPSGLRCGEGRRRCRHRSDEAIAAPRHRLDKTWAGWRIAQYVPQSGHRAVETLVKFHESTFRPNPGT